MAKYVAVILMAVLLIGTLAVSDWMVICFANNLTAEIPTYRFRMQQHSRSKVTCRYLEALAWQARVVREDQVDPVDALALQVECRVACLKEVAVETVETIHNSNAHCDSIHLPQIYSQTHFGTYVYL